MFLMMAAAAGSRQTTDLTDPHVAAGHWAAANRNNIDHKKSGPANAILAEGTGELSIGDLTAITGGDSKVVAAANEALRAQRIAAAVENFPLSTGPVRHLVNEGDPGIALRHNVAAKPVVEPTAGVGSVRVAGRFLPSTPLETHIRPGDVVQRKKPRDEIVAGLSSPTPSRPVRSPSEGDEYRLGLH
ncbi:MAG: hypothetical protein EBZ69_03055 [Alphaproteobacteria bacterium]|nr:hypothetical protein [Alphaproteobacteria bacterium]NDC55780.1 hypothetical protein [Alphaproteobacteria bacterium]